MAFIPAVFISSIGAIPFFLRSSISCGLCIIGPRVNMPFCFSVPSQRPYPQPFYSETKSCCLGNYYLHNSSVTASAAKQSHFLRLLRQSLRLPRNDTLSFKFRIASIISLPILSRKSLPVSVPFISIGSPKYTLILDNLMRLAPAEAPCPCLR